MNEVRVLIAVIGCFCAAIGLTWKMFARPIPKKSELMVIEGVVREVTTVTRKTRSDSARHPVVHIEGRIGAYRYLDWFPDPDRIHREVQPGDRIRFLSDTPDGNRWIWQLEKGGRQIVTYDEVFTAVSTNRGIDPYLAALAALAGGYGVVRIVRARRTRRVVA